MDKIRYIILDQKVDTISMDIVHCDGLQTTIETKECVDISRIENTVSTFHSDSVATVMRVHISANSIKEDNLFKFIKDRLVNKVIITKSDLTTSDHVYEVKQNKVIILVTKARWKQIMEAENEKHTADHANGRILCLIYQVSQKLILSFVSSITAKALLPKACLETFKKIHFYQKEPSPTIQWCNRSRYIYKIKDYPKCVLQKVCPKMHSELASLWDQKVLSLLSVLYFVRNECVYEIGNEESADGNNEYTATLDWMKGTFITNKIYMSKDITLIAEVHEPHLSMRWGYPEYCSVVGKSGTLYYGNHDFDKNILGERCALFLKKILTTSKWYRNSSAEECKENSIIKRCEFIRNVYQSLFDRPILISSDQDMHDNYIDKDSLMEELSEFAVVSNNQLHFYFGYSSDNDKIHLFKKPIEAFPELFLNGLYEGQKAITNGFVYYMTSKLFRNYQVITLQEEL